MASEIPRAIQEVSYERAAQDYLRSLPPEHFRETVPQATQREITLGCLALLEAQLPEVHVFNEILVQYPLRGQRKLGQVVPDNMVIRTTEPILANLSYNLPLESASPFWVLDYIFEGNPRKDYQDNLRKYERELKVPYSLMFHIDTKNLALYRHNGRKYVRVKPNDQDRCPILELELEVGLLDGWVRFWYQGNLLMRPTEMQRAIEITRRGLATEERRRADEEKRRADEEKRRADDLQRRLVAAEAELTSLRGRRAGP